MDVHYECGSAWTEHHRSIWTEDKIAELREIWNTGLATRDIADHLGGEFTRSAVIGKAHRLLLERHKAPVPGRPKRIKPPAPPVLPPPRPLPLEPPPPPVMRALQLVELAENHCRFPLNDPHLPGFYFCASDAVKGRVYCDFHHKMSRTKRQGG